MNFLRPPREILSGGKIYHVHWTACPSAIMEKLINSPIIRIEDVPKRALLDENYNFVYPKDDVILPTIPPTPTWSCSGGNCRRNSF